MDKITHFFIKTKKLKFNKTVHLQSIKLKPKESGAK